MISFAPIENSNPNSKFLTPLTLLFERLYKYNSADLSRIRCVHI